MNNTPGKTLITFVRKEPLVQFLHGKAVVSGQGFDFRPGKPAVIDGNGNAVGSIPDKNVLYALALAHGELVGLVFYVARVAAPVVDFHTHPPTARPIPADGVDFFAGLYSRDEAVEAVGEAHISLVCTGSGVTGAV